MVLTFSPGMGGQGTIYYNGNGGGGGGILIDGVGPSGGSSTHGEGYGAGSGGNAVGIPELGYQGVIILDFQ